MGRAFNDHYYTSNGKRHPLKGWYIEWRDATGRKLRRKGGASKAESLELLRHEELKARREKSGITTRNPSEHSIEDLMKFYSEFQSTSSKSGARTTTKHAEETGHRIQAFVDHAKVRTAADITQTKLNSFVVYMQRQTVENKDGEIVPKYSNRTINAYTISVKGLCSWATTKGGVYEVDPVAGQGKLPESGHTVRNRRAMTDDEIRLFLLSAEHGPERRARRAALEPRKPKVDLPAGIKFMNRQEHMALQGIKDDSPDAAISPAQWRKYRFKGECNVLAYRLMLDAGLRLKEVSRLTWADVDFEKCTLTLKLTKSGSTQLQPISETTRDDLQRHRERAGETKQTDNVLKVSSRLLRQFDEDLEAAQIEKHNDQGSLDLHALRHTFASRLSAAGVPVKTLQAMLRHSTVQLTLDKYAHTTDDQQRDAYKKLDPEIEDGE